MLPRITNARYLADFRICLQFSDGVQGDVDLASELNGPIFEPLRDIAVFRQVRLHPELRTLVWPNGADFAPEFLRAHLRLTA
jgi:hypothetical protein